MNSLVDSFFELIIDANRDSRNSETKEQFCSSKLLKKFSSSCKRGATHSSKTCWSLGMNDYSQPKEFRIHRCCVYLHSQHYHHFLVSSSYEARRAPRSRSKKPRGFRNFRSLLRVQESTLPRLVEIFEVFSEYRKAHCLH